jgi:pimeloyl-ACP methyl ester carboxylesterase
MTAWRTLKSTTVRALVLALSGLYCANGSGDIIAIGNQRLHIQCEGRGLPSVILDAGLGGSSLEWVYVKQLLQGLTRVCSFDRAGYGNSDMGPMPRTSSGSANELYLLLEAAEVARPYILVAHSYAGYSAQIFARRYPFLSAGLVLVDASHPEQIERFLAPPLNLRTAPSSRYGIVQFSDPPPPHQALPAAIRAQLVKRTASWKTRRTFASELLNFGVSAAQLVTSSGLGQTPLVVVTRGNPTRSQDKKHRLMERLWLTMQTELAAKSRQSVHLVARNSGHHVHIEQPNLVAFAIAMLIERFRRQSPTSAPYGDTSLKHHFEMIDAIWLRDTLPLYPLATAPTRHFWSCDTAPQSRCDGGAP